MWNRICFELSYAGGVAKHFLQDGQVDRVANRNLARVRLGHQPRHVGFRVGERDRVERGSVHRGRVRWRRLEVVVRVLKDEGNGKQIGQETSRADGQTRKKTRRFEMLRFF